MRKIILQLTKTKPQDRNLDLLTSLKRDFARTQKLADIPSNIQLLQAYYELLKAKKITKDPQIKQLLKKRAIRSQSWIVSVQVLTKPFPCPGKCIFCPNDPTMPKSYIKSEPGAMRALLNKFDPIKQVYNRLLSLQLTGHETDKIEMIVLWWTFDVYTKDYKIKFVKELYDACNTFNKLRIQPRSSAGSNAECRINENTRENRFKKYVLEWKEKVIYSKSLKEAMKINESAAHRIIWLTIETRPEYVTDENCQFRRELWITRIEMGVQSLDEEVLAMNKRGHTVQQAREACHKMRQYGFKFCLHIMPGLYGFTYAKDLLTFKNLYTDPFFKPDEIKFYPTSVIPNTQLCNLYKQGKYKPLETKDIQKLIRETFLTVIPPYTRIKRLIRDIPANEIVAWSTITNLAQLMHNQMNEEIKKWGNEEMRKCFYGRLYGEYTLYSSLQKALKDELEKSIRFQSVGNGRDRSLQQNIQTYIVGKHPDVKSFRNFVSLDTRSREIRHKLVKSEKWKVKSEWINLIIRKYLSSGGAEYFISFEDQLGYLYGFTRLLLPTDPVAVKWLGKETAIIRELHVYGNLKNLINDWKIWENPSKIWRNSEESDKDNVSLLSDSSGSISDLSVVQHKGFWKQLMEIAEQISHLHKYKKLSVISGIWVRAYYRKLWYKLEWSYMVKKLLG